MWWITSEIKEIIRRIEDDCPAFAWRVEKVREDVYKCTMREAKTTTEVSLYAKTAACALCLGYLQALGRLPGGAHKWRREPTLDMLAACNPDTPLAFAQAVRASRARPQA